jgi:hypothetical protein
LIVVTISCGRSRFCCNFCSAASRRALTESAGRRGRTAGSPTPGIRRLQGRARKRCAFGDRAHRRVVRRDEHCAALRRARQIAQHQRLRPRATEASVSGTVAERMRFRSGMEEQRR